MQQVRDLERLGVIPIAARDPNGYRRYFPAHLHALRAYRALATAIGPVEARATLIMLSTQSSTEAAATLGAVHVRLAGEREQLLLAQQALNAIGADAGDDDDAMTIRELADALGVRTSTLRFWEREGLVTPERVTSLRVRRYDAASIRALRIVAALRGAGYRIPAVRRIVGALDRTTDATDEVLRQRLEHLAHRQVALLRAGADLADVIGNRS